MNFASYLKMRSALLMIGLFLAIASLGCSNAGEGRAPVAGEIRVGGQPLANGRILFVPLAPNEGPSASALVVNGKYELERKNGPVIGKNRVEVEADIGVALDDEEAIAKLRGRLPSQPIPPQYNRNSVLVYEVTEGQPNTFDIAVPSGRQTVSRPQY
jgi:hypothetical protein